MASPVPGTVSAQTTGATDDWQSRIKPAAYTPKSGTRILFTYEDVSREFEKRTEAFEFPKVDGAYVQDNGAGPRAYPLRCIFWGKDCDRIATAFEAALLERGQGRLEHPMYGPVDVVPDGRITRRDDLVTAANQTIVEVTFLSTIGAVYPSAKGSPKNEINDALGDFDVQAAQQFNNSTSLQSAITKANAVSTIKALLNKVRAALATVSAATSTVNAEFKAGVDAVNDGMDVLIGEPLLLAQQIAGLIRAPAEALIGIESRLDSYSRLLDSIIGSSVGSGQQDSTPLNSIHQRVSNDFHSADLFALSAIGGSAASVLSTQFSTKPQALDAAQSILTQFSTAVAWRDGRFGGLAQVDTGEAYQAMQQVVALVAGYLIEVSFSLVPERRMVTNRPRTIIDLAFELYGSIDDKLDFLIDSNDLTGSEILEVPRGRLIKYYPA